MGSFGACEIAPGVGDTRGDSIAPPRVPRHLEDPILRSHSSPDRGDFASPTKRPRIPRRPFYALLTSLDERNFPLTAMENVVYQNERFAAVACAFALLCSSGPARGEFIKNGGFEKGNFEDWTQSGVSASRDRAITTLILERMDWAASPNRLRTPTQANSSR